MKRSRAAIRFNEPRSRGSRSLRGSRAVHCAIRQILKKRHRGWVRTGASVREGRTPFFSVGCGADHIVRDPVLLTLSLSKRMVPRCRAIEALKARGVDIGK